MVTIEGMIAIIVVLLRVIRAETPSAAKRNNKT